MRYRSARASESFSWSGIGAIPVRRSVGGAAALQRTVRYAGRLGERDEQRACHHLATLSAGVACGQLLRHSLDARRSHLGRRSAATLGMVQELVIGRELVRLLDALVMPWLEAHSPGQVGEWKTLTRFVRPAAVVEKAGGEAGALPASPEAHAA